MTLLSLLVKLTKVSLLRTDDPRTMIRKMNPITALITRSNVFFFMVSSGLIFLSAEGVFGDLGGKRVGVGWRGGT